MIKILSRRTATVLLCVAASTALVGADRLVMRDGRRIDGELISVRGGTIEFEENRGFRGTRTLRLDRDDVERIEFDERGSGRDADRSGPAGRPAGLREREVVVSADVAWNDAGVDVRSGQVVYFSAVGKVRWGPDRRDGPAGEEKMHYNPNRPMPSRPAAALIGKVGESSTDYFFIGDEKGPIRMRSSGRLYLGINDDILTDNSGNFRVTVYY